MTKVAKIKCPHCGGEIKLRYLEKIKETLDDVTEVLDKTETLFDRFFDKFRK